MSKLKGKKGKPAPPRGQPKQRTYTVELDRKHALEPIASISEPGLKARVFAAVRSLATNPRPDCKKLSGTRATFRGVRVGDCLLVYAVDDARLYVLVVRAGDRKEIYPLLADLLR